MSRAVVFLAMCLAASLPAGTSGLAPSAHGDDGEPGGDGPMIDPLGPNAACYVCHLTFVHEQISSAHRAEKVTCIKCHGLSADHANDEDIGATPPDIRYTRNQVDAACGECHEEHDVPAADVLARFFEQKLEPDAVAVCTDCHGRHRIAEAAKVAGLSVGGE